MPTQLVPEFDLLLACCRAALPQPTAARQQHGAQLQQLVAQGTWDWPTFLHLVEQHGVQPLVYQSCQQFLLEQMPAATYQHLKQTQVASVGVAFQQLLELVRLIRLCQQHQLAVTPLKGVILAQRLYGDVARRTSCDIDLLVDPAQLPQAEQLLVEQGYHCTYPDFALTPKQQRAFRTLTHHSHYEHPDRQVMIELHWRPYAEGLLPDSYIPTMLQQAQSLVVGGKTLPCLADGDLLLYLCLHGAKHHWSCLKWVCDVAALLQAAPAIDWARWQRQVVQFQAQQTVGEGLLLAHAALGAPLPDQLAPWLGAVASAEQVWVRYADFYAHYHPDLLAGGKVNRMKLRTMYANIAFYSTPREWWAMLQRWWLTPQDWRDFPLPDPLFPLYYLLRPLMWLWRHHWPSSLRQRSTPAIESKP